MKIIFIANLGFCSVLRSSQEIRFQVAVRAEWKKGSRLRCFQVRIKDCSHETVTGEACFDGSLQGLSFLTLFRLPFPLEKVCFLTLVLHGSEWTVPWECLFHGLVPCPCCSAGPCAACSRAALEPWVESASTQVSTGGREELSWAPLLRIGFSILSKFPTNLPFLLLVLVKRVLGQSESKLYGANRERCAKTVIKACINFSTRAVLIPVVLFELRVWRQLGMHWWEARRFLSLGKPCIKSGPVCGQAELCCIVLMPSLLFLHDIWECILTHAVRSQRQKEYNCFQLI